MAGCFRFSAVSALVVLVLPLSLAAQGVFFGSFERGDTGDWSQTVPPRCDVIQTFDRGLVPTAELHVATGGDDSSGDGSAGSPFATIGRAVQDATPGTAVRVHSGIYSGGTFLADVAGTPSAPIWMIISPRSSMILRQENIKRN